MNHIPVESCVAEAYALSAIYDLQEVDRAVFKSYVRTGYFMESGVDYDIVTESVSDTIQTFINGIRKFIEKVKEFFKKILLYITSAHKDLDKLAKDVKPIVDKMDKIEFTIQGYKFTVLDTPGPNTREFQSIVDSYNEDMKNIKDLKIEEVKREVSKWLYESHLDQLRGDVLGVGSGINQDDFLETVRKHYRNGETSTSEIKVDKMMIDQIIRDSSNLTRVEKDSIKDRDTLCTLLKRTEQFFSNNVSTSYRKAGKSVNVSTIDTADNRFRTTDNFQSVSDAQVKAISVYVSLKSRQVNRIAGMINTVASERVNALKDQIKQERVILRKCLFGNNAEAEKKDVKESLLPDDGDAIDMAIAEADGFEVGFHGVPYDSLMEEANIIASLESNQVSAQALVTEAMFLMEAYETGELYDLMEAGALKNAAVKVKNSIKNILLALLDNYKKKSVELKQKYLPWVKAVQQYLPELAQKSEVTMVPFYKANTSAMASEITKAYSSAYDSKDYGNVSFARTLTPSVKTVDDLTKINDTMLINYFRIGEQTEKLQPITIKGNQLASEIEKMATYCLNYDNEVTKNVKSIEDAIKSKSDNFKVTESALFTDSWISLIDAPVCESDLVLCRDYGRLVSSVMEAGDVKIGNGATPTDAGKSMQNAQNASGGEGKVNPTAATGGEVDENGNPQEGNTNAKVNEEANKYKTAIDSYFRKVLGKYTTAREEQFLAYLNAIKVVVGASPKFEGDKYVEGTGIPKQYQQKEKTESK
jgi:hypothetical protein